MTIGPCVYGCQFAEVVARAEAAESLNTTLASRLKEAEEALREMLTHTATNLDGFEYVWIEVNSIRQALASIPKPDIEG